MTDYFFETISPSQALSFVTGDTLFFTRGTAVQSTVIYDANGDITVSVGALSVEFAGSLALSWPGGYFSFPDGSHLYVGDANANIWNLQQDGNSAALFGGGGNDLFTLGAGGGVAQGNQGNDQITALGGSATLYGGQGDDVLTANGHDDFLQGNKGDDFLAGGTHDTILGGQGDDVINHGSGILNGNLGNDHVTGGGLLLGEGGNDTLTGEGTPGGFDTMLGGDGNDSLTSNVIGGASGASMDGGDGNDTIQGGQANDTLSGGDGNDSLSDLGGRNQVLDGGGGDDTISSSGGSNLISGGAGADKFIFGASSTAAGSVSAILDWDGSQDSLSFLGVTPNPSDYTAITAPDYATALTMATTLTTVNHFRFVGVQVGPDVILFAGDAGGPNSVVELVGRSLNDFSPTHNLI